MLFAGRFASEVMISWAACRASYPPGRARIQAYSCIKATTNCATSIRFQAVNQTEVLLLVDDCFLLLSFHPAALTIYRVAVSKTRHSPVSLKKGLLWGIALSAVQQTICAEVVFRLRRSTAALDQRID